MNAKGRNGWIKVAGSNAWYDVNGSRAYLDLWSRRQGSSPPVQIAGTPDEMRRLGQALVAAADAADAVPPCRCAPGRLIGAGHAADCPHATSQNVAQEPAPAAPTP